MKHRTEADQLIRTVTPGRLAQLESDVFVPGLQGVLVGASVGLAVGVGILLLGGPMADLQGRELWTWALRLAGVAAALSLAASVVGFVFGHRKALWKVEELLSTDLDGDHQVGKPELPSVTRIELVEDQGRHRRYLALPVSDAKLHLVARACLWHGKAFSRRELGNVLSQGEYAKLSAAMLGGGLLRETPTGRELTASGRAVLRRYA